MGRFSFCVEGVRLEAQSWVGRDLPILMLHEGLGSVSMWGDFPERLAASTGNSVFAWSRQGHGASDPLSRRRDPDYMHREADLLPRVMDALRVERAHLFGHSDGGSIALIAAAIASERVASLVLEAPHVFVEKKTTDSIAKVKSAYDDGDLGRKLARHHRDADHVFSSWNNIWLDPRFRNWNIEADLESIRCPALLIQGHEDEYATFEQLHRVAAVVGNSSTVALPSCRHSPHRDQPGAVLSATTKFLRRVDPLERANLRVTAELQNLPDGDSLSESTAVKTRLKPEPSWEA